MSRWHQILPIRIRLHGGWGLARRAGLLALLAAPSATPTLLADGRLLVTGGRHATAEVRDRWTPVASLSAVRADHQTIVVTPLRVAADVHEFALLWADCHVRYAA